MCNLPAAIIVVDDSVVETLAERLDEVGMEEEWVF